MLSAHLSFLLWTLGGTVYLSFSFAVCSPSPENRPVANTLLYILSCFLSPFLSLPLSRPSFMGRTRQNLEEEGVCCIKSFLLCVRSFYGARACFLRRRRRRERDIFKGLHIPWRLNINRRNAPLFGHCLSCQETIEIPFKKQNSLLFYSKMISSQKIQISLHGSKLWLHLAVIFTLHSICHAEKNWHCTVENCKGRHSF